MLDRAAIASRIPHAGRMCLLERVEHWNERVIRCTASSHHDPDNPLREARGLSVWAAIEYAAQSAAVHGSLMSPAAAPRPGVLGALRNVQAACEWLDRVEGELVLEATLLHTDPAGSVYRFEALAGDAPILTGQFTLMYLNEPALPAGAKQLGHGE